MGSLSNIEDNNKTYSGKATITTNLSGTMSTLSELTKLYGQKINPTANNSFKAQDTTNKSTTDKKSMDTATEATEGSPVDEENANQIFKFNLAYDSIKFVNPDKGLFQGNFTLTPDGIKNLNGSAINVTYKAQGGIQNCTTTIKALSQEMITIATAQGDSKMKSIVLPEKSIPVEKFKTDVTAQYNALLEIDLYTPAKATITAMNNPIYNQIVKMYFIKPGYSKLNGKQTAVELKYVATLNPSIKPIFLYGYKLTKAGKNPGLDKISE